MDARKAISDSLKSIKVERGLELSAMATIVGLPTSTFTAHYYGQNIPSLHTIIDMCNRLSFPINTFLKPLITVETEEKSLSRINDSIHSLSEWKRRQICRALDPIINSMVEGFPKLKNAKFGQKVRVQREDMEMSQRSVAELCNITVESLRGLEANQRLPSVNTFIKFCNVLHLSPEYLLQNELRYSTDLDSRFYALTPRQLSALADTVDFLCRMNE